tara:strand:+ start:499 stop:783 length:285 start_codon:yes stop_codon:yes gene_type:complete
MKYYIISKIELEGTDSLKYTDVGYTEDVNITNEINEQYDITLGVFLGENRTRLELGEVSISTFFNDIDSVNEARTEVENVEELNIVHITNLNQL